jgi:rhamnosyltransferase
MNVTSLNNLKQKRAAIFANFDKDNKVDDYVVYYLQQLKTVCNKIVFVSTSDLPEDEIARIAGICNSIIKRSNDGHDFMSYKIGLQNLNTAEYDELIICNDSVYGPFFPLNEMFSAMERRNCSFWGVTESLDVAYHIQSYFMVFKKEVFESACFKKFWRDISVLNDKSDIIGEYEVGLSQTLLENKFKSNIYISFSPSYLDFIKMILNIKFIFKYLRRHYKNLQNKIFINPSKKMKKLNPTLSFWEQTMKKHRMPFLKIGLLRDNPYDINMKDFESTIKEFSDYNTAYIKRHLDRIQEARHNR